MAGKLQQFQALSFRGWASNITKANHLGSMLQLQPQKASPVLIELLSVNYGKNLDIFLSQFGTKVFETDADYTWDLVGNARRNIPLKEARDENGQTITAAGTMVGAGGAPFELVFSEAWFFNGEVLGGELNEAYPIRILGDAKYEGTDAVYLVELMGGNTKGMPSEELLPGKRFSYEYAPVSRGLSVVRADETERHMGGCSSVMCSCYGQQRQSTRYLWGRVERIVFYPHISGCRQFFRKHSYRTCSHERGQ